jgi:hypothetical protein
MSNVSLNWEPWPAPPLTAEQVREWEEDYAMRLPATLARALVEQNGGRMRESELVIDPLDNFSTLDEEQWAHVIADGSLKDLERAKLLYIGDAAGCGIVLDYNREPEPRVLLLHHEVGGELRDEGIGSFEDLLCLLQRGS